VKKGADEADPNDGAAPIELDTGPTAEPSRNDGAAEESSSQGNTSPKRPTEKSKAFILKRPVGRPKGAKQRIQSPARPPSSRRQRGPSGGPRNSFPVRLLRASTDLVNSKRRGRREAEDLRREQTGPSTPTATSHGQLSPKRPVGDLLKALTRIAL